MIALAIALHKTNSKDKAEIIRALADLFRAWFRRGGPPGGPA